VTFLAHWVFGFYGCVALHCGDLLRADSVSYFFVVLFCPLCSFVLLFLRYRFALYSRFALLYECVLLIPLQSSATFVSYRPYVCGLGTMESPNVIFA
jgi:hypothetical protein